MHVAHDGFPAPLRSLAMIPALGPLSELLFSTLRREPRDRPAATAVRKELQRIAPSLQRTHWPLGA